MLAATGGALAQGVPQELSATANERTMQAQRALERMSATYSTAPGLFGASRTFEETSAGNRRELAATRFRSNVDGVEEIASFPGSGAGEDVIQTTWCQREQVLCQHSESPTKVVVADVVDGDTGASLVFAGIALHSPELVMRLTSGVDAAVLRALCLQSGDFPRVADYRLEHADEAPDVHVITIATEHSEAKVRIRSESFTLASIEVQTSLGPTLSGGPGGADGPRGVAIRIGPGGEIMEAGAATTVYKSNHVLAEPFGEALAVQLNGRTVVSLYAHLDEERSIPDPPKPAGTIAASFTLTDVDGIQHGLEDYRGKVVILDWWADT